MSLTLHMHPLSSYCHKVLIALYELEAPFEPRFLDLGDDQERSDFLALWPIGQMPVLEDRDQDLVLPESSIIIEYIDRHRPGAAPLIPADPDLALQARLQDRFFDFYVHTPMQKIVFDNRRPEGLNDPFGANRARAQIQLSYDIIERRMEGRTWAVGDDFSLADCSAAPALYYADSFISIGEERPHTAAYLERLKQRPSYARVLKEAEPYLHMVPR